MSHDPKLKEAMAEINYMDKRTPIQKEKEYKEYERIAAKNKKIYNMLLGKKI